MEHFHPPPRGKNVYFGSIEGGFCRLVIFALLPSNAIFIVFNFLVLELHLYPLEILEASKMLCPSSFSLFLFCEPGDSGNVQHVQQGYRFPGGHDFPTFPRHRLPEEKGTRTSRAGETSNAVVERVQAVGGGRGQEGERAGAGGGGGEGSFPCRVFLLIKILPQTSSPQKKQTKRSSIAAARVSLFFSRSEIVSFPSFFTIISQFQLFFALGSLEFEHSLIL